MNGEDLKCRSALKEKIRRLKGEKNAVILAHYYQEDDIQDIADIIGDSLQLARKAAETDARMIVFDGVHFMAETAMILNPGKKVVLPDIEAGCSLAASCPPDEFRKFIEAHPGHTVVSYINCSAEIKAMSDIICTSSNAVEIIARIPATQPVIFAPDRNLGEYLRKKTGRELVLWDGVCEVHEKFSVDKLETLMKKHPNALVVAHPESPAAVLERADFTGSTSAMLKFVSTNTSKEFIVATEAGILRQMALDASGKTFYPAPAVENNTCACSECRFMKLNTLEKLYRCMEYETPQIAVPEELRQRALRPLERMLNPNYDERSADILS